MYLNHQSFYFFVMIVTQPAIADSCNESPYNPLEKGENMGVQ
jgi:hypothetical protein